MIISTIVTILLKKIEHCLKIGFYLVLISSKNIII